MTNAADQVNLDSQLCFSFYSTSIAINRLYKPLLDGMGITYPQFLVLSTLWEQDERTIGEIAERLALESSTVTPLVKRLEQAGFLARRRNTADERQVHVSLTDTGRALKSRTKCLKDRMLSKSGMTMERILQLNADVQALLNALTRADAETTAVCEAAD